MKHKPISVLPLLDPPACQVPTTFRMAPWFLTWPPYPEVCGPPHMRAALPPPLAPCTSSRAFARGTWCGREHQLGARHLPWICNLLAVKQSTSPSSLNFAQRPHPTVVRTKKWHYSSLGPFKASRERSCPRGVNITLGFLLRFPLKRFSVYLFFKSPRTPRSAHLTHISICATKSDLPVTPEHFRQTDTTHPSVVFFLLYFPSVLQVPSHIGCIYLFIYGLFHPYPREYMLSEDKDFLLFTTALPVPKTMTNPQ